MTYYISNIARSKGDPKVIHSGPSSLGTADRMAKALGWFSIGLGLTELIAAERITRALGMEGKEGELPDAELPVAYGYGAPSRCSSATTG